LDAETLERCFKEIGNRYGYEEVSAEFTCFRDAKVSWGRSPRGIRFRITDYLSDAPCEVLSAIAFTVFENINGGNACYPDCLREWMIRPEFVRDHQAVYLERCEKHTYAPEAGCSKNLYDSLERLKAAGLVDDMPDMKLLWMKDYSFRIRSYGSSLMRTVMIASELDSDEVPDFVIDWFLYKEMCQLMAGYDLNRGRHERKARVLEEKYPRREEAEGWMEARDRADDEKFFARRIGGTFTEHIRNSGPEDDDRTCICPIRMGKTVQ